MLVKFLGDLHGDRIYGNETFQTNMIQIGDLDLYGYDYWQSEGRRFFIDGNHDNFNELPINAEKPQEIKENLIYIPRGFVSGKVMFFGGADSIDKNFRLSHEQAYPRLAGKTWYYQESITDEQIDRAKADEREIDVMVAHDLPDFVTRKMCDDGILGKFLDMASGRQLTRLFQYKMPKLWICGHFHLELDIEMHGCRFIVLDINQVKELDVPLEESFFNEQL